MGFKEEYLYDFAINMSRILVAGNTVIVDNIKKVEIISNEQIIVKNGKRFTAVLGKKLIIKELADERMLIEGEIEEIQFYGSSSEA